jgi:F-type H+-transporting ATPase subunit b
VNYTFLKQFASSEAAGTEKAGGSVLDALGVNWKLLVFQLIAFTILVWLLSKYVFPVLMKAVDDRQAAIEESNTAAIRAEKQAAEAQATIDGMMRQAKHEAGDIVATAKNEAASLLAASEQKSKAQAEHIVTEARHSIDKEVIAAKRALHNETIELVALATEKVVGKAVTASVDKKLITNSLKETAVTQ